MCVLGYCQPMDRILLVKLKEEPFNIGIIVVYAPTAQGMEEEIDKFRRLLDNAKIQCKSLSSWET